MRGAAIVLGVVALVVAGALAMAGDEQSPLAPRVREAAVGARVVRAAGLEVGVEHVYDVELVQSARAPGSSDFTVTIRGGWAVTYAGVDDRGRVYRAELRDARPHVQRGAADATAAFTTALARPYFFTTTADGRLIAMHFERDVDAIARGAMTTLAATFQVSRGGAESWEAIESDSVGDYVARYRRTPRGLHRERMRYQRVVGDGAIAATVVKSGTDVVVRTDGWPAEIAGHEVTRVGTADLGVEVDARFTLRHRTSARVAAGWHDGFEVVAVDAVAPRDPHAADRELVDGATLPDLLAALAAIDDAHARGHQFLRIAALLRLDAEAVRAAERSVIANESTAQVLVAALGEAGTPDAQRALATIARSAGADESRTHAVIALGLVEAPTVDTLRALADAARERGDQGDSATLAQGNAALRLHDDDPAAAARQVDELLARFARAVTDDERILVLRALGNTGDPRIVAVVEPALASSSVLVRAAATEALRLVRAPIDALVVGRFADGASLVRGAAVFAASQRDLTAYLPTLARAVRTEGEVDVRRAIVELAGARIDEHAALRAIVEHAAAHDADADIKALAAQLLAAAQS